MDTETVTKNNTKKIQRILAERMRQNAIQKQKIDSFIKSLKTVSPAEADSIIEELYREKLELEETIQELRDHVSDLQLQVNAYCDCSS